MKESSFQTIDWYACRSTGGINMKDELLFWNIVQNMLMRNTGSTTVLLEAIIGCEVNVKVFRQEKVDPNFTLKWKGETVCRETALFIGEKDVSRNVVYINWEGLGNDIRDELILGKKPIGKIIMDTDHRRKILYSGNVAHCNRFIHDNSCNDIEKQYEIWRGNLCLFVIKETYFLQNLKYCVNKRKQ